MKSLTATTAVIASIAVAGCGGTHPTRTHTVATGCRPAAANALRTIANTRVVAVTTPPQFGITGCSYRIGPAARPATTVAVIIDRNPQGLKRFDRAVVETNQNSLWSKSPSRAPRLLSGVLQGADWIPGDGRLLASDGQAFLTIVVAGQAPTRQARALAVAAARGSLRARSGA
jgi:hypothetical protein